VLITKQGSARVFLWKKFKFLNPFKFQLFMFFEHANHNLLLMSWLQGNRSVALSSGVQSAIYWVLYPC
jgi:hypothetical protein